MKKISIFLSLFITLAMLQGCHGGGNSSNTTSSVRLVNGIGYTSSIGMLVNSINAVSGVTYGNVVNGSLNTAPATAGYPVSIQIINGNVTSTPTNVTFTGGINYTLLAYTSYPSGQQNQPTIAIAQLSDLLPNNQTAPASGGMINIVDLASNAGALDVYIAPTGSTNPSVTFTNVYGTTNHITENAETYQIWVTGAGAGLVSGGGTISSPDLRLYIPSVTISKQQVLTLALTDTMGGVLVDGLLVPQQGSIGGGVITPYKNGSVRVRIAEDFTSGNITSVSANGVSIVGSTSPGTVSPYVVVPLTASTSPASPLSLPITPPASTTIMVNNISVPSLILPATPGTDLTLLAYGTLGSPSYSLLNDDNTLPDSGYAKLRLVNGINSFAGNISLTYNGVLQPTTSALLGAQPTPIFVPVPEISVSPATLQITDGATPVPLLTLTPVSQAVYSVFMLGTTAASGVIVQDR
jgi:hypothetical protein